MKQASKVSEATAAAAQDPTNSSLTALTSAVEKALTLALRHEAGLTATRQCLAGLLSACGYFLLVSTALGRNSVVDYVQLWHSGAGSMTRAQMTRVQHSAPGLLCIAAAVAVRMLTGAAQARCFDHSEVRSKGIISLIAFAVSW